MTGKGRNAAALPLFAVRLLPAFCMGAAAVFLLPQRGAWTLWAVLWVLAAVCCLWRRGRHGFQAACVVAVLLSGVCYSLWRTHTAVQAQLPDTAAAVMLEVAVTGLPERGADGRVRFTGTAQTADGRRYRLLFYDYAGADWQTGSRWRLKARVRPPVDAVNPVGFNREAWALANGIDGVAAVAKGRTRLPETDGAALINRWRGAISAAWQADGQASPQGAALMQALAVGDRSALSAEVWAAVRPLGLNHLISISGLHITLVAVLAAWLVRWPLLLLPRVPARPRVWQLAAGVTAAAVYAALAGWEVPTVRSLIMLAVLAWAWWRRGQVTAWQAWWTALAAVLLYRPASVLAAGFWLSFGLVAVLLWALAYRLPESGWRQALRGQWAAAGAGTLASVWLFGLLPLFSPLVNAVAIPWFSWLLTPLALAASVLPWPWLREQAAWLAQETVEVMLWLGRHLPEVQAAHAPAPLLAAALVCWLLWLLPRGLRVRPLAACGLLLFALYRPPPLSGSLNVTVWDVGQGLAVLLETGSHRVLFDTGTPAAEMSLLPNLRALGIKRLDALVLSHHDNDHDGGYADVAAQTEIGTLWAGQPEFYRGARYCAEGVRWQADGVVFEFLTPPRGAGGDNDNSCVLRAVADGQAVLITGDLGRRGEQVLVEKYGADLFSQLLVLGHHGSKTATSGAFVNAVSPQIGVASSGYANPFGHPHPQAAAALSAHGARLMRTDRQGALRFVLSAQGMTAQPLVQKRWWQRKPFAE